MERLTERYDEDGTKGIIVKEGYGKSGLKTTFYQKFGNRADYSDCEEGYYAMEKLAEYEDLEEQGKLLKLPCAVGNTVYCIYSRHTKCSAYNEEFEESTCRGCESECDSKMEYYINKQRAYSLDWIIAQIVNKHFGKLVFLTREEAETALKKLEG